MTEFEPLMTTDIKKIRPGGSSVNSSNSIKRNQASDAELTKAAEEFEAMFIADMLKNMFDGIKSDTNTGGGKAEEMYKSMMVDEYGKIIARTGGIGVADQVKKEMIRLQEEANATK